MKVLVQPMFVLDDGETIEELNHQPIVVQAAEWPSYASGRFKEEVAAWQKELDAEDEPKEPRRAKRPAAKR